MLDPENAGKTPQQMVHEGLWGYQRGNGGDGAAVFGSGQPGWREMQKAEARAEAAAGIELVRGGQLEDAEVDPSSPSSAQRSAVTLGDFVSAARTSARVIHPGRPSAWTVVPLAPRPVTPVAVSWPHARTMTSGAFQAAPTYQEEDWTVVQTLT